MFRNNLCGHPVAGHEPERDFQYLEINKGLCKLYPQLVADVIRRLDAVGASVTRDTNSDLLLINGEYSATMVLSRCQQTPAGSLRWLIQMKRRLVPDIKILVRMVLRVGNLLR